MYEFETDRLTEKVSAGWPIIVVRNCRKVRLVFAEHGDGNGQDAPGGVVIKLKEWNGEELHILGHGENFYNNGNTTGD